MSKSRCPWCGTDPSYRTYHDREWGLPVRDERTLFEQLCLEGQQAGLSWLTVLRKRERYRSQFHNFEFEAVARMPDRSLEMRLRDAGLIRNRLKIFAIRNNGRALRKLHDSGNTLTSLLWRFVDGQPIQHHFVHQSDVPSRNQQRDAMSHALKQSGFSFCGTTICYALMQATGLVNDHLVSCYRHAQLVKN